MVTYERNTSTNSKDWANITPPQCFSRGLIKLLETHSFKDITLSQLSKESGYGRATFYRYFEDIHELLSYCWTSLGLDFRMDGTEGLDPSAWALVMFRRLYIQLAPSDKTLHAIGQSNAEFDVVWCSLRSFIQTRVIENSRKAFAGDGISQPIRPEVVAEHVASTVTMLLLLCFVGDEAMSKEEAEDGILHLLNPIIWENRQTDQGNE